MAASESTHPEGLWGLSFAVITTRLPCTRTRSSAATFEQRLPRRRDRPRDRNSTTARLPAFPTPRATRGLAGFRYARLRETIAPGHAVESVVDDCLGRMWRGRGSGVHVGVLHCGGIAVGSSQSGRHIGALTSSSPIASEALRSPLSTERGCRWQRRKSSR